MKMLNLGKNHILLALVIFGVFAFLSLMIAVIPANTMQHSDAPLPGSAPLSEEAHRGLNIYIREGCVGCHTQQVRNIEMDHVWGDRPSIPDDYYYVKQRMDFWRQTPSVLGSERTGPDLSNIGQRNPSETWHLMHLFNPRIVVPESVMPRYPWLFTEKDEAGPEDVVLNVPPVLQPQGKVIVATQDAKDLVAYLLSLKQTKLPAVDENFIPSKKNKEKATGSAATSGEDHKNELPDGAGLYQATCAVCHQPTGEGLPGAFPPLKGSAIVTDDNPEKLVRIILMGYDARPQFATMPALGEQLSDEEIAAIINFERSHWGNSASPVNVETVKKIRASTTNE